MMDEVYDAEFEKLCTAGETVGEVRDVSTGEMRERLDDVIEIMAVLEKYDIHLPDPGNFDLAVDIWVALMTRISKWVMV